MDFMGHTAIANPQIRTSDLHSMTLLPSSSCLIDTVAANADLSRETLCEWEDVYGLITSQYDKRNGRWYTPKTVIQIDSIRTLMQRLGITAAEVATLSGLVDVVFPRRIPQPITSTNSAMPLTVQTRLNELLASPQANFARKVTEIVKAVREDYDALNAQCWLYDDSGTQIILGKQKYMRVVRKLVARVQECGHTLTETHQNPKFDAIVCSAVPLLVGQTCLGVLVVIRDSSQFFTPDDIDALTLIAAQLTGAVLAERSRHEVREREQYFNATFDAHPDGVILYDQAHNIVHCNTAALDLASNRDEVKAAHKLGNIVTPRWDTHQINGKAVSEDETPSFHTLQTGVATVGKQMYVCPDPMTQPKVKVPLFVTAVPITDAKGSVNGALVRFQDITEVKSTEILKEHFVRNTRHDVMSPLTNVIIKSQMLERRARRLSTETICQYASQIGAAAQRIFNKLDILDNLDRIIEEPPSRMSLVSHILPYLRQQRTIHGAHRFRYDIDASDTRLEGYWNPSSVEGIIDNLIQNALKYSPADSLIVVKLRADGEPGKRMAHVEVIDQGYGVHLKNSRSIFEEDKRSITKTPEGDAIAGTGHGLKYCDNIVKMYNGSIWVESDGVLGSTFHVKLPLLETNE